MSRGVRLAAMVLLAAATACDAPDRPAPGFDGAPVERAEAPSVEVLHNAPVAFSLTIYLQDAGGERWRLGRVGPSESRTFELPDVRRAGDRRLVAVASDGRWRLSPPFSVLTGDGVSWDVDQNRLWVRRVDRSDSDAADEPDQNG